MSWGDLAQPQVPGAGPTQEGHHEPLPTRCPAHIHWICAFFPQNPAARAAWGQRSCECCTCMTLPYFTTSPCTFLFSVSFCFCSIWAACWMPKGEELRVKQPHPTQSKPQGHHRHPELWGGQGTGCDMASASLCPPGTTVPKTVLSIRELSPGPCCGPTQRHEAHGSFKPKI